jgi:ribosomal protein S18 acetylase RimI-like enzyme
MTTPPTFTIRSYRSTDHDTVLALNAYGLAAAGVPEGSDVYAGDLDEVTTTYLTGRSRLLVGVVDGRVVAMGALRELNADTCEITRMRVDARFQGRGYGKATLTALERQARHLGFHRAVLLTGPDQHPAVDLYRASGYVVTAVEQHGQLSGIRMGRDLGTE